jgi:hypothetical protein
MAASVMKRARSSVYLLSKFQQPKAIAQSKNRHIPALKSLSQSWFASVARLRIRNTKPRNFHSFPHLLFPHSKSNRAAEPHGGCSLVLVGAGPSRERGGTGRGGGGSAAGGDEAGCQVTRAGAVGVSADARR